MLKHLTKYFTSKEDNPAQAETQEEVISMTQEENQVAAMAADNTAALTAQLNTVTEAMTTLQASFAELNTKYEAATTALAQSSDAQAKLVANAKAATLTARTTSLAAVMGDVKAPLLAASLESLDDATFATVLSGYAASFEAESKTEMFNEVGVAAEATPVEAVKEESAEMKIIKAKQAAASLQTN